MYPAQFRRVSLGLQRAAAVAGFTCLLAASELQLSTPAPPETAAARPETLPWDSTLTTSRLKATLALVLDANAPSAVVSLNELRRTVAGREETVNTHVVFVVKADEFVSRELWGEAVSIPGAHVIRDAGGVEATRLAATSGTAVLYRADRNLLFRGATMQELPSLLDHPTTNTVAPPRRKDAANRRPGPLDDWIEPGSTGDEIL